MTAADWLRWFDTSPMVEAMLVAAFVAVVIVGRQR